MRHPATLSLLLFASVASAQTRQYLEMATTTSFASRGGVGLGAGELLQGVHTTHWRGLGDNGTRCEVASFRIVVQDQNAATQGRYFIVMRNGSDTAGPTTGIGGLILRAGPVTLPAATGVQAWQVTSTLQQPAAIPCDRFFAFGVELPAAGTFPTDGLSIHTGLANASCVSPSALNHAWQIVGAATRATQPTPVQAWRVGLGVENNLMMFGSDCGTWSYGLPGMFPIAGKQLGVRIEGNGTANTTNATVLLTAGVAGPAIPIFPGVTRLWVNSVPGLLVPIGRSNAQGDLQVAPLGRVPTGGPYPPVFMQVAYLKGTGDLSNAPATQIF